MPRSALALTLALVCSAAAARAATITVGPGCSLGQAILAANSDAAVGACAAGSGTDTIQIGPGVIDFDGPWSLVTESLTALPVITSNLDLVGAGATITVLRRDPTAPEFRFLKIGGFVGVTVRDIGFDGGDVMSVQGAGGAIEIDWNYGGGSTLTLERCAFTNNAAYSGGAIYARLQDALIVRDSTFTGNTGSAGAIGFQESGAFVIQRSTFDGNTSINGTAAFYGGASAVTIEDTDWNDNVGSGGASALFVSATVSLSISGNRFVGNTGGVAVWLGASATGTYEIVDSTFEANVNTANVAGLLAVTANPLAIRGCTFVDNEGFYQGGAAFIGNTSLEHTTRVEDTTFRGNTSLQGGAAYITGGGLTEIDGCTFDHNRATTIPGYGYGRGGALVIGGPTVITSSVFNGNGDEVYQTWIEVSDASAKESGDAGAFTLSTYTNGGAIAADTVAWSVSQSCFVGNGATAVVGPGTSDARNNWWGAASGPGGGGPGAGDTIASDVKHLPFLGAAPAACVGLVRDLDPILVEASFATAAGYATPGADLAAPTMPFVVDPTVGALVIPIVPVNDALVEGPEVARVDLASSLVDPVAYVLYPGPISAELVIEDDGTGCGESCDDAVACTIDVCDSGTLSCTHTPDHAACDDGKACTIDTCTLAGCTHTPSDALCDDDNPCTSDACTVGGTCAHTDVDGDCADADPCTTGTICVDGQCAGGTIIPGCETRKIDLGAPFGEVLLPVPTGDLCFSGSKIVPNCQPLGECQIDVNACFHPNQTWVDVVIAAGLDLWGRVPFRGLWRSGGFCVVADLPDLGAGGPITTTDGTLWACWDGAGKGTLMARATAWSAVAGVTGTSLAGTLEVSVTPDETVRVEGCLTGDVASTDLLAGLPGTLSTSATLTLCLDGGAVVHLREWRPFRDDPSVLVTDVEATFFLDALGRWQLRIDQPLDPIINLCRFILKAGRVIAERVDAERWVVTRRGVASFDFAGQHVETEVTGTVSDEQATLELTSAADLDLFLKIGDPDSDAGGIHVRAPKRLQQSLLLQLDAPELRSLRLACDVATTTVDVYGTTTLPLCDQTITSTVTVHGELGRAGFTMTGSASVSGAWRFPAPLLLPGLPPLPGPLCLGLASEADPTWTVCGAPPADGLWLHTTTTVPLFATSAAVELRVGLAPPETATAYARLAEPLALVAPDDHVPGVTSLTIGAGEVALDVAACGSGESALALQAEATLVTTRGNPVTAALSARATPTRVALELHTKGRWIEPFGLPGLALEQGSDLAFVQSRAEPSHFKLGFDGLAYLLWSGDWPPESPSTPGGEVCNDLPAADEDRDGFVNCLDQDCQNHLFCRSGRGDGQILGLGAALYYDHALRTSAPGPVSLPAISLRFDAGRLIESRVGLDVPSLVGVLEDTAVLDADPTLGFPDERGPAGRLTPLERAIVEGVTAALREGPGDLLFRLSQAGGAGAQQGLVERLRELVREMIDRWIVTSGRLDAVAAQIVRSLALGATSPSGPGLCDVVPLACDDRYLGTSFFRPSAISLSASTRDATFDGNTFSAGMHVIVRDEVSGGTIERHGSFGPTGLTLASYALATQDDGAELLNIPNSDELSYLRIGLGGDPYDRHATFPGDLDHGITIGPAAALAITSQGTVEGTVSRASWTDGVGDAVLASRSGGGKGWGVTLGQSDGTGFARVIMYVFRGGGLNLPTVTRTLSPVVPAGRPTHVAVTWETMTLDGEDVLDVAIYVDGRRQPLDPLYEHPPVPPDVPGAPLRVGAGLGTLDDLRVWKVRRPAMRVAGERLLLPPVSASSPDLIVAFDFDQHDGRAATRVSNRGPLGAALPGALEDGVTTAPDSGLAWSVLRLVSGDAAAESSGLDALAGLTLTTLFGPAHFRVELHAGADDLAASLYAREIPLVQVPHVGRTCLVDVALAADIPAQRASGQAKAAICRDAGPSIVGTVAVELGCPQGASCPTPPQRHVAKATGTVGPVVITPEGAPPLTLSGALTASTGSQEVRVSGALAGAGLTLTGDITLSSQGVHIATSLDPPPLFGVDLGPASCELDLDGQRLCGTCRTTTPACAVVLCVEVADGSISGAPPTCASVDIDKLPDGAPCVADVMCQSGHCGVTASVFSPFCYTPGSGGDAAACDPGLADQCLADLVCVASGCNPLLTSCVPWSCRPHVDLGVECVADAQCDPGQICKRPSWFLPRICVWPDRSRDVGESCYGPDECTTAACALGGCVCTADHDCPSGERCVLGACEPPPEAPRLPGQSCTSDSQCIVSYTNPNAGACVNGTCGCSGTADCQSSARYCGLPITDLPYEGTTPVGICLNKLPDGAPCAQGVMCGHDHCGGFLRPPVCYSPVTRRYGEACVAHDECVTGRCQLTCNWGGACAPPPPGTLITAPPPGCACTTTCGCASDVDCPGGWYCGAFTVDLGGVPGIRACLQKGATGSWCDGDNQCQSGDCFDVCINGHCQGACR